MIALYRKLRELGALGINARNTDYTLRWNRRRNYPLVDDKLQSKRLCEAAGIPTPAELAVAHFPFEVPRLMADLADHDSFVLKPARGAMGNGILVIRGKDGEDYIRAGGRTISPIDVGYHASSIISGLYALGGHADVALVEERVIVEPSLAEVASDGVPDIRVVVFRGVPVMVMMRLPTSRSGGRANLHQGALGVGVDLVTGRSTHAVLGTHPIREHPDSGKAVLDIPVPAFEQVLEFAVRATDQVGLGYVGADVVIDAARGPMILELNARPGLMIQIANHRGLLPRLQRIEAADIEGLDVAQRIALGREIALSSEPRP